MVITGIGAVTPVGSGAQGLWAGVHLGRSAVALITRFDATPFRSRLAAEICDFDPSEHLERRRMRRLDRFSQLALVSALQCLRDADVRLDCRLRASTGCYLGSALGGIAFGESQYQAYLEHGVAGVSPFLALAIFGAAGACNIAIELGLQGPSVANSNSCASGAIAIGEAFRLVREGKTDLMLAGGAEAPLAPLTFGSFAVLKSMSTSDANPSRASRPFDAQRDGFVMGEGAAMLLLESLPHALARDARIYAEIRGYATTNDAHDMVTPLVNGDQAARAIELALADAQVSPEEVDYVNAHASSTRIGDAAECQAITRALGDHAQDVWVSGNKGLYGHPLGASSAIETAISALALCNSWLPGTTNLEQPDANNSLRLVGPAGITKQARVVVKNAFGFGGTNAALVLTAVHV